MHLSNDVLCASAPLRSCFLFHLRASAFICGAILLCSGCIPKNGPSANRPKPYYGQTLPMSDVVGRINANNSRLPTLWASIASSGMELSLVDEKKKRHDEVLGGTLLYRSPREVKLIGRHDVAGDIFQVGSNPDLYWVVAKDPGPDTAWWGRYKYLGAECAQPIPIRPDLVLEVLGISTINEDLTQLPVPVMRFNHGADAYMLIWNTRLADRWVAVKEVWYDRATLRPKLVVLFDPSGRVVLEAHLSQHVPVEVPGLPREKWPTVAGAYDLFFPESSSRIRLKFSEIALSHKGAPNDLTFKFIPQRAGVSKVIQLDEACGP